MSKRPATEPDAHVLTDPRAIRALAHPARLAVLEALGDDGSELTATDCAELAGLTPSAMSYHLRALANWGFIERAPGGGDGRERPWRAVHGGWRVEAMPDAATAAATSAVTRASLQRLTTDLSRWFERERTEPAEWQEVAVVANHKRWLTAPEVAQLHELVDDFLAERRGRTAADHPDGARPVRVARIAVPIETGPR